MSLLTPEASSEARRYGEPSIMAGPIVKLTTSPRAASSARNCDTSRVVAIRGRSFRLLATICRVAGGNRTPRLPQIPA